MVRPSVKRGLIPASRYRREELSNRMRPVSVVRNRFPAKWKIHRSEGNIFSADNEANDWGDLARNKERSPNEVMKRYSYAGLLTLGSGSVQGRLSSGYAAQILD